MCGISAIISSRPESLPTALDAMVAVMNHRGPDGRGTWVEPIDAASSIGLGHNRLSIIDLSDHASQPMRSRDGRYVLVYNGEVYNYQEIALELDPEERPEPGFGDTAIVLAALIKWGPKALARFNGMWALILCDTRDKTLLVSRDRFGIKPLYYYRNDGYACFASEIKGILAATEDRFRLNPSVVVPYLTRGLLNVSDETFFEGVRQFPPASYQLIDLRQFARPWPEPERFWLHPFEAGEEPSRGRISPQELRAVFVEGVRLRLRSDVPVGVLLSGGVDSSAIVGAVAASGALGNVTVFSVTSDDPRANEERFIDCMAAHVHLVPRKVNVSNDPMTLLEAVGEACWFNDEPLVGVSDLAHLQLMQLAKAGGVKVLLSGQGADEQLGGYNKFLYFWVQSQLRQGHVADAVATLAKFARHSDTLYEFRISEAVRYLGRSHLASATFIQAAHHDRDRVDIGSHGSYPKREWIDLTSTSVPALLHREDRMSMAQSVELRVPFLDYRVVECLARVHPSEKFEGGWTKAIFRKAIAGLVPEEIRYRRDKKGFNVPDDAWMRGPFRQRVLDSFGPGMMAQSLGFVDAGRLRALYGRFVDGRGYLNGRHFFRAHVFEVFVNRFAAHVRA